MALIRRVITVVVLALLFGATTILYEQHMGHTGTADVLAPQQPTAGATTSLPTATPPATPTVEPTATIAPTATPALTATPVPPTAPQVHSPTDPDSGKWYAGKVVTFAWAEPSSVAVAGYSYAVDQAADGTTPETVRTTDNTVTLGDLTDGAWYLHVRALSTSEQWGPATTFAVHLDRVPLTVTTPKFSAFTFNPNFFQQDVWFNVSKPTQLKVMVQDAKGATVRTFHAQQPKAGEVDLTWDGKTDEGAVAPPGKYSYLVSADDGHGHQATAQASDLAVTYDRIVVSLSKQSLTAYDGSTPVVSTLVTTGNQVLPTPVGVFPILGKYSPFTFHSPWPAGSPFWYADSPVTYALLFDDRGYYIHDAPWRHDFGPGSNTKPGTPGQDLTGSHGCVNVSLDIAKQLYDWAPTGTAVQVIP